MANLSPASNEPILVLGNTQYSTLEFDNNRWLENNVQNAPIACQELERQTSIRGSEGKLVSHYDEKITRYNDVGKQVITAPQIDTPQQPFKRGEVRALLGSKRNTRKRLIGLALVVIVVTVIGGSVGGTRAIHKSADADDQNPGGPSTDVTSDPSPTTPLPFKNTGLAAMQWTDLNGTLHRRLYYQDFSARIRESSWDNSSAFNAQWDIHTIGDAVKSETPIAAVAGYPHANHTYSLVSSVKNVYFMSSDDELIESQAPSNDSQAWENDNFSGLYSATNASFLTAYWNQDIPKESEELVVLFQKDDFANGITQGRYTSNRSTSNPWVTNNFGFSQPKGSAFAFALVSYRSGKHMMLYTVDDRNNLQQHEYTISDNLTSGTIVSSVPKTASNVTIEPRSPLAVVAQDNQPLFTTDNMPECTRQTPLTHLILFTVPDRSSLVMNTWNCTDGFVDHKTEIEPLQRINTTYLALAAVNDRNTGNGTLYVMFDSGRGPQVEEWVMPKQAGNMWVTSRNVTVDFGI